MKFKEKIINKLFGDAIEQEVQKRMPAASMTDRDEGWRKLTESPERELAGLSKDREIEIAYSLWKTNPLGRWIINIMTAFICGDGFTIEAKNEKIKELLEAFWEHPVNNLKLNLPTHIKELGVFGELLLPKFVSQYTGKVALGYIDPAQIKRIVTDPENIKIVIGVITRGKDFRDGKKFKTVLPPDTEDFLSNDARAFRESCQYECYLDRINNLSNETRGQSDLSEIADWLDIYEQFLFDMSEKWVLLNAFVWDLIVQDGTADSIAEQVKGFTKKSGSVYGHNQKVTLQAATPDLKTFDTETGGKVIRNHILGAKGIPSFWFGGAQDSNLAVSQEMSAPTYKMFSERQKHVIYFWQLICDDVVREADAHGMLKGVTDDERAYKLNTPELASKDITKFASAIAQLTTSLVAAVTSEFIDKDTAVKGFAFALAMIGYEFDVDVVQEKIKEEAETKGYEDYVSPKVPKRGSAEVKEGEETGK